MYPHFLAVPLLCIDNEEYIEEKFCGSVGSCEGGRDIDDVLNAFLHHTYEDSGKKVILADLQGTYYNLLSQLISNARSGVRNPKGEWTLFDPQCHTRAEREEERPCDFGKVGLEEFEKSHKCNKWCRHVGLTEFTEASTPIQLPVPMAATCEGIVIAPIYILTFPQKLPLSLAYLVRVSS